MDLQKIRVRKDLERMVINYRIRGDISEDQCAQICDYIDRTIGGGFYPRPAQGKQGRAVIPFPATYTGLQQEEKPEKETEIQEKEEEPPTIYAPYGEPLPEGVQDFREVLQRDGLALIGWRVRSGKEGILYNVLWAQSGTGARITRWSGLVREEDMAHVMPEDSDYWADRLKVIYDIDVAPDSILSGPFSNYKAYIEALKNAEIRNSAGEKVNFDYKFIFAAEKQNRFLTRNKELVDIRIPTRVLTCLDEREIHTIKGLQRLTVQEIRKIKNLGPATVNDTIAILKKAGITLQEEKRECEEDQGQLLLEF